MGSGWANEDFTIVIISAGAGFSGLFVYAPSPGLGNLTDSVAAQGGTDPYGNTYLKGITSYGTPLPAATPALAQPAVSVAGTTSPITVTLGSNTTAGNCLIVSTVGQAPTNPSVTGITIGGSADHFAQVITAGNPATDFVTASIWADPNCAGGQTSVVVTFTSSAGPQTCVTVEEWSGLALSSVADRTNNQINNVAGNSWSSTATPTTSQASEIAIGVVGAQNNVAVGAITGPGAPWTNIPQVTSPGGTVGLLSGWQVLTSTGTPVYSGTFTSDKYTAVIATFKALPAPTQQAIQLSTVGGVVVENLFTGTVSEAAPAQLKAGAQHVGTSSELQQFVIGGPTNTGSNDAVFMQLNSSSVASPNSAQGSLEYQLPAGGDALLVTWGAQGVSRASLAGLSGGIPLTQMDFFTRTATTTGLTAMTRSYSIPANDAANPFSQQTTYHFRGGGTGTMAAGAAVNATLSISFFGTNAYSAGPSIFVAAGHNFAWYFDVNVMMSGNSSTGPFITFGFFMITDLVAGTTISFPTIGSGTVNNTVPSSMVFNWQWASVVGGPTISCPGSIFSREGV